MIKVTDSIALPDRAIKERFVRSIGSRAQNANRDATAVELRFDISASSLPPDVQTRLIELGGGHVTKGGVLVMISRASDSQAENRRTVRRRLVALVKRAVPPPNVRRLTRLPAAVREDRVRAKHRQSLVKRARVLPRTDMA